MASDHISAQALAEVLKVQIEIISSSAPDTETLLTPAGSHVDIKIILGCELWLLRRALLG